MIVYKVTNIVNGKSYIGQTIFSLNQRQYQHINDALSNKDTYYFHRALRKHGPDNFTWEIIHDNIDTIEELNKLEIYYIGKFDTFENGYNLTLGGGGVKGRKCSEETRQKLSKALSGEKHPLYGKKHSEESKRKMSETRKGRKCGKNNPKARAVIINNKYFDTRKQAAKFLGFTPHAVRYRILHPTKWIGYAYSEVNND